MSKMGLPTPPHDTVVISDRLVDIVNKLRVAAMAVKGIAAENHDEDAYAISNLIFDVCEEIGDVSTEICPCPEAELKIAELRIDGLRSAGRENAMVRRQA